MHCFWRNCEARIKVCSSIRCSLLPPPRLYYRFVCLLAGLRKTTKPISQNLVESWHMPHRPRKNPLIFVIRYQTAPCSPFSYLAEVTKLSPMSKSVRLLIDWIWWFYSTYNADYILRCVLNSYFLVPCLWCSTVQLVSRIFSMWMTWQIWNRKQIVHRPKAMSVLSGVTIFSRPSKTPPLGWKRGTWNV